jgi:nitrogen fixation/metabolism regulation signal transduction histidine kinase
MIFNKHYILILIRVILLSGSIFLLSFLILLHKYYYSILGTAILVIIQIISLIIYLNGINTQLKYYLDFLKENDPKLKLLKSKSPNQELNSYFEEIIQLIERTNYEKESQYNLLKSIIEHITIGLLIFDDRGKIRNINKSAKDLLRIESIRSINELNKPLNNFINSLSSSDSKLFTLKKEHEIIPLSIKLSKIKSQNIPLKVLSIQNIKNELDEKEIEAWQQLIKIIRHEIMNSVTPITTLTTTIKSFYERNNMMISKNEISESIIEETINGLNLIEERGIGLMDFVQKFKSMTQLPELNISTFDMNGILQNAINLFSVEMKDKGIELFYEIEIEKINFEGDKNLMEQVFINLFKNAIEALQNIKSPKIVVELSQIADKKISIKISDNGKGILREELENIFLPFYTTKENGSGIGLSFSRQIIHIHGGTIQVKSETMKETTFLIELNGN